MKTILSTLLLTVLFIGGAAAQETTLKPEAKTWGAEVNFAPFSSSPVGINYIRLRHFSEDNKATRLGIFIGGEIDRRSPNPDLEITNSTFEINLRPGLEWHFSGTDRLSPYLGGELDLAYKSSRSESVATGSPNVTTTGAWTFGGTERGFFRFGMNAVAGTDFYVAKNLYMGVEFGFGFEVISQADIEEKIGNVTNAEQDGGSTFRLGPNINSAIRLGFNF